MGESQIEGSAPGSVVVTVNVPRALEETFVDWLLERDDLPGFTTYAAYGHTSRGHGRLSAAEQVLGRQRRTELRVEIPAAMLEAFLAGLRTMAGGANVYYFVTPVVSSGHLG